MQVAETSGWRGFLRTCFLNTRWDIVIETDGFELASKLGLRFVASISVTFVVLNAEWTSSLAEALLLAIFNGASVLGAEISILDLQFNAGGVFAELCQMSCTQIVVNSFSWVMGLSFIAVHNDALVVGAVVNENSSHIQGSWITAITNFAWCMDCEIGRAHV